MIEVRSSYLVRLKSIETENGAVALCKYAREKVWPVLDWQGRVQQMLHGHAQQSLFVWSSEWENLAAWEKGMVEALDCPEYQDWAAKMGKLGIFGEETEVFSILEPRMPPDNTPGKIEVRSSYIVQLHNVERAKELIRHDQEVNWPLEGMRGQYQQMIQGKAAQSMFVFSSVWDSLAVWEEAMNVGTQTNEEFEAWYEDWSDTMYYGGPREIFRNL